ncbi:TldD/PmbA family protein [Bermanella marisrubri]|uniref:Putative PmbA-related protein n=1 Tax=Bermanella marisrubri TaxID=207949 RepID=Q1N3N2_9GAMM|nr:TldD/PmbA family protein [Bermanella marisrubri]EAT12842.1 putative PmbA-related protein [Oceanobacter sp. RED65] [Bermanella marisrubri]QIZ83163.1 TldD/PmbA family protein [Bermanella marisrubri]
MMNVKQIADYVLQSLPKNKVRADLIIDQGKSLSLKANQGEISEQKVSASKKIGLRVFVGDKVGIAYTEASDEAALDRMVKQAQDNAMFAKDEPQALSQPSTQPKPIIDLCPKDTSSTEQKINDLLQLEAKTLQQKDIRRVPYNGINQSWFERSIFNTEGLALSQEQQQFSAYVAPIATKGDDNAMNMAVTVGRRYQDLQLDKIVSVACTGAQSLLASKPIKGGHYDVIFRPDEQANLFKVFSMVFSAKAAKDGTNPWLDDVGKQVASAELNIMDDPHLDGMGYQLFDDEGVVTKAMSLIEHGVLQGFIHNQATAHYFNAQSTGHAQRSPTSNAGVGIHQWHIKPGAANRDELLQGEYLEIMDLEGLHSGANPIAGTFSFGASGYLCRDGERLHAVRGITVAGNFYDLLKQIIAISDTTIWSSSQDSLMAPVRFSNVSVSA